MFGYQSSTVSPLEQSLCNTITTNWSRLSCAEDIKLYTLSLRVGRPSFALFQSLQHCHSCCVAATDLTVRYFHFTLLATVPLDKNPNPFFVNKLFIEKKFMYFFSFSLFLFFFYWSLSTLYQSFQNYFQLQQLFSFPIKNTAAMF